jgi:hypothetical protein
MDYLTGMEIFAVTIPPSFPPFFSPLLVVAYPGWPNHCRIKCVAVGLGGGIANQGRYQVLLLTLLIEMWSFGFGFVS